MAGSPGLRSRCTVPAASTLLLALALALVGDGPARADDDAGWARKIDGVPQTRPLAAAEVDARDRVLAAQVADEIDPVVGRIGDRTIRFFELLNARREQELRRLGAGSSRSSFRSEARRRIEDYVRQVVIDELTYQSAMAALTDEERAAFVAWQHERLDGLIDEHGGGDPVVADANLRAIDGQGLIEKLAHEQRRAGVSCRLRTIMGDRLAIEDEEIERVYERDLARYVTPASRRVRMIRTSDPDAAARIGAALAAGTSFAEVAKTADNAFRPADGGALPDPVIGDDGLRPPLGPALITLRPGAHSPRLEHGAGYAWIALEDLTPEHVVPFADARDGIRRELYGNRHSEAMFEYEDELMARDGVRAACEEMANRALRTAVHRYAPTRSVARPAPLMPPAPPTRKR